MEFVNILNNLINEYGSQTKLANVLEIKSSQITEWRKEKCKPGFDMIKNISNKTKLSTDYLLGLENEYGIKINPNILTTKTEITQEDEEMQQFWNALRLEYKWKLIGRAAALLEEQQQRYK